MQQLQPCFVAFFGVELGGEHVVFARDAGEILRVGAGGKGDFGLRGGEIIAVDKVKTFILRDVGEQGMGLGLVDVVPAHVGDFEAVALRVGLPGFKAFDAA